MASRHRRPCQCRPKFIVLYKLPALPGAAIPKLIVLIRKSSASAQYVPVLHKPLPNCSLHLIGKSLQAIHGLAAQASMPVPPERLSIEQAPYPARRCYPCASMQSPFGLPALKRCAFRTMCDVRHLPRPPKPPCYRWVVHCLSKRVIPAHRPLLSKVGLWCSDVVGGRCLRQIQLL